MCCLSLYFSNREYLVIKIKIFLEGSGHYTLRNIIIQHSLKTSGMSESKQKCS